MGRFTIYDEAAFLFFQEVLMGNKSQPTMERKMDGHTELTVTLHTSMVEIVGHDWTADHCKVVRLNITPDAVKHSTDGRIQCQVDIFDAHTRTLTLTWKKNFTYEDLENADDLLGRFFRPEELEQCLSRYGVQIQ